MPDHSVTFLLMQFCSHGWLGIDMEDVGGAAWAIISGKCRDHTVVEHLDPLDRSVDAVATADGEVGEAFINLVAGWGFPVGPLLGGK